MVAGDFEPMLPDPVAKYATTAKERHATTAKRTEITSLLFMESSVKKRAVCVSLT